MQPITLPAAFCGNCLDIMPRFPDQSFDMILCDLPYAITRNSWDISIPLEDYLDFGNRLVSWSEFKDLLWTHPKWLKQYPVLMDLLARPTNEVQKFWEMHRCPGLWAQYKRLIKPNGAIILFGSGQFSAELMRTGKDLWRYNLVWHKTLPVGFLNANRQPLRAHEDILVFYKQQPNYYPQKTTGHMRKVSSRNGSGTTNYGVCGFNSYDSTERFPTSVWTFATDKQKSSIHPTQKPVKLLEELIKTYTNEGAIILNNCAGSFSTAVACENTGRQWVCIEKNEEYFRQGLERINQVRQNNARPSIYQMKEF